MKRRTKILLLLVFALVLGFIFLLPHGGYRRAVTAYKQQLLAQGEKLTIAELAPPPVLANASNGAKAFLAAMSGYSAYTPSYTIPTSLSMIAPGVANPMLDGLSYSQMTDYDQNTRAAAALRVALNNSVLDFNLDYSLNALLPLPHLPIFKQAELLASGTALQALCVRHLPEAVADLNAAVDLLRLFPREAIVVSGLVRVANARIAVSATWEALQSDQCTGPQLAELETKWNSFDLFDTPEAALAMERASVLDDLSQCRKSYITNLLTVAPPSGTRGGVLGNLARSCTALYFRYPAYWAWRSSWSYDEELFSLQVFDAALQLARRARAADAFVPAFNEFNSQTNAIVKFHPNAARHFRLFQSGEETALKNSLLRLARGETVRRLTVVAIALKRHHLQHGAYPANLAELTPDILPRIPADFMDGQPLRYRLKPDGNFLLYSVGEDGKDDGGDATHGPNLSMWEAARDLVWPRAATPQELADYLARQPAQTNSPAK